ncbi:MAG: hypothetical protein ABW275_10790 [Hansschlegelia sp.]
MILDTFSFFKPFNVDDVEAPEEEASQAPIEHGDLVAAIANASHPGVAPYQIDPVFNVRTLAADIGRLAGDIETGKMARPAAVVSSIVLPFDVAAMNARGAPGAPFAEADLFTRRAELRRAVTDEGDPENPYTQIGRGLDRLSRAGVPVFVAAGNTGPDATLNLLALSDGVYAVGSLGRDGARTAYTSAPAFVSVWSPGYVVVTETPTGLSVSGGRGVELRGAAMPEQKSVIEAYVGRRAGEVVHAVPKLIGALGDMPPSRVRNRFLQTHLPPGLYRTQDLMSAYGYRAESGNYRRAVEEGPYMHFPSDTIFRADVDDVLSFDPLGDGSRVQLQLEDATSFAAPNICAKEQLAVSTAATGR